jgi:hypothetical protein
MVCEEAVQRIPITGTKCSNDFVILSDGMRYSIRSAIMGSTLVARRAGK